MIPLAATIRSNRLELHRRLLQILGQLSAGKLIASGQWELLGRPIQQTAYKLERVEP